MPLPCIMAGFHFALPHTVLVEHLFLLNMLYTKGGLPSIQHNEIRDLTATLLTEVCSQVSTEPELQPVSQKDFSLYTVNVQDGAWLDIVMNGFWEEIRVCICLCSGF